MKEDLSHWPTTTVGKFFNTLPWYGRVAQTILIEEPTQIDWRLLSAQEFFSHISWDGRTTEADIELGQGQELSYSLSVREFWGRFVWQGRPKVGMVQQLDFNQFKDPELNLNDLSDLF